MLHALVVDNNPVLLKAISAIVEQEADCRVVTAIDGLQALEAMKDFTPDIIFTDLVMPLVDGEMLCKIVRHNSELQSAYIVVISAVPLEQTQQIMNEVGCDLCIVKGTLKELRAHIRQALDHFRKHSENPGRILGAVDGLYDSFASGSTLASEILLEKKHREEIVAYLSEGVIVMNEQGKIVEINRAALDIFKLEKEQVIGIVLDTLGWGGHSSRISEWLKSELRNRHMEPLNISEEDPLFRDNQVLTVTLLAVEGTNYFGICIVRDITRLYRAEEYKRNLDNGIRLVKKMEAMSGMAGGVAHDFNNLLTVLCGNIDMISGALNEKDSDRAESLLGQAKRSALSVVELARKISHFSPYGIVTRENCEAGTFIQTAVQTFAQPDSVKMSLSSESMLPISIDVEQMRGAVHNVLENGIEAAGNQPVVVSSKGVFFSQPLVTSGQYVPAGSYAKLSVSDSGKGIEPAHLVKVFDPYFSTKTRGNVKGMGLGLAVVYSTLRNHGGYVTIESRLGQGTTVSLFVPFTADAKGGDTENLLQNRLKNSNVILIEEDEQSRQVGTVMLEFLGLEVVALRDGGEVADYLERSGENLKGPVAALVNLPGENPEEGVRIARLLQQSLPDLPLVATSGSPLGDVMTDSPEYGFVNAMAKPYTIDDLRNIFASINLES